MDTPGGVDLGTELAGRKIWLVKVPAFVAAKWRGVCAESIASGAEGPGPKLATLRWEGAPREPGVEPERTLQLEHPSTAHLPRSFKLRAMGGTTPMVGFAEGRGRVAVEGKLVQRFDVEMRGVGEGPPDPASRAVAQALDGRVQDRSPPPAQVAAAAIDPEYRRLSRERHRLAAAKTRTVQILAAPRFSDLRQPAVLARQKQRQATATADRRLAMPKDELTAELFRLFERQSRWTFAQLQRQTDQPTQHLKNILVEIAAQNRRGPYKDLWELKKGYQLSNQG